LDFASKSSEQATHIGMPSEYSCVSAPHRLQIVMKHSYFRGRPHEIILRGTRAVPKCSLGCKIKQMSARAELARRVLQMLANGKPVPERDAFQLRNWAVHPEDVILTLREIALRILSEEEKRESRSA
jgi:hypothetical protein